MASIVCLATFLCGAASVSFYPNTNLTDTSGNIIQAHGGTIIQDQNALASGATTWYWFGQDDSTDTDFDGFLGVPCYKSDDGMASWDYLGLALSPTAGTAISDDAVVERPKVLYNAKNDEYVMWFHLDNSDYGLAEVGVATSSSIEGPYTFLSGFSPLGHQSRDMGVYQDPDTDEAYLIFATDDNANLAIALLNDDYTNTTEVVYNFTDVYWEAPGVIKNDDTFYLIVSPQNGWTPTANIYMTASSMSGPWSDYEELAPTEAYTYLSQNAYDLTIVGSEETTFVYFGDRWNGDELFSSTYSFLPLEIDSSGTMTLHNTGGWSLDVETGAWADLSYTSITAAESSSRTTVSCTDDCSGGKAVSMTDSTTFTFTWDGSDGDKIMQVQYTYSGSDNSFLNLGVTVGGVAVAGNVLIESTIAVYTQQAPIPLTLSEGDEVVISLLNWNGDSVLIEGVDIYVE
ncbi:hypothetical protein ASPZODRAFT_65375 [Penicilliopsis zonata CBS 506.65]|uniref:CBM6 domain-containing protein n=1 Tax=Penicilliopsis zonata CBS 506.65 TaxID=1073090 RepID=A0A1L9SJC5_9EURO|nr:hypothetical protein ASPZODRAFT_65375 [Penicilliopsis zonata CBS 506.65]OJJ47329.1 hypothetical protein ASPZODRAFT_65375 [Penicilliopsis zonata CBS 506.65]